jgi:hypothetical protein
LTLVVIVLNPFEIKVCLTMLALSLPLHGAVAQTKVLPLPDGEG